LRSSRDDLKMTALGLRRRLQEMSATRYEG
jgi:hypothetical protein